MLLIIFYDVCIIKKDFVMVVWWWVWFSNVFGICCMYGSESNLDNMYFLVWWIFILFFLFCKVVVKNKVISYLNVLKVKECRVMMDVKCIVESFIFEEIIVDL